MRLAFTLALWLLTLTWAQASSVSLQSTASLTALADRLDGDLSLMLDSSETVYDLRVTAIQDGRHTGLYGTDALMPGEELSVTLELDRRHPHPGRYHLLLSFSFKDVAQKPHALSMAIPYTYDSLGGNPSLPLLVIDNRKLHWNRQNAQGEMLGLDLTTGPHWRMTKPVSYGETDLALTLHEDAQPIAGTPYVQSAVLNWLGDDGYHYSRLIPWELAPSPAESPSGQREVGRLPSPLIISWLLLAAVTALAALYFHRRREPIKLQRVFDLGVIGAITLWLTSYTHPEMWLLDTWPTGGDLASHVLYAQKFSEWLAQGKITGWMPEVFAGFPAFRFYFPLPFAAITLLTIVFPIQSAIKLVVILPALLLPAAVYWMAARFHWPSGARLLAALCTTAFLIHDGSAIWGGNLMAVFAGEFAYSWGMIFVVLFWGALAWSLERGGRRWIAPAILLALTGLSHGYPLLVAGFSALLAPLFTARPLATLFTVLRIHATAFLLIGLWLIPLLENIPFTIPNDTSVWVKQVGTFIPDSMLPLLIALPILPVILKRQAPDSAGIEFLLMVALLAATGYFGAYAFGLADIRLFPFTQLALAIAFGGGLGLFLQRLGPETVNWSVAIAGLLLAHYWLDDMTVIEQRAAWNFGGYEKKVMWPHYQKLAQHLSGPDSAPRVLFEHDPANTDIGSTRAMEALPLFGSRPVLEGLYMEAAFSGPFVYQLQAEVSHQPSSPLARFPSVKGTANDLGEQLRRFYADTVVVRSPESIALLNEHPAFALDAEIGPFRVFKLRESPRLVELTDPPLPSDAANWLERAFEDFVIPPVESAATRALSDATAPAQIDILAFEDEYLKFRTDRVGEPHLVKMTYHPGWYSRRGEVVYLADPAFILLIPESEVVELIFGNTPGQRLGRYLSLAGLLALLIPIFPLPGTAHKLHPAGVAAMAAALSAVASLAILNHPSRHYQLGHEYFFKGQFTLAAEQFENAIVSRRVGAQRAEALFWSARASELGENPTAALRHYQQLLAEIPASYWAPESLYRLALLHEGSGDIDQSADYATRLQTLFPRNRWSNLWRHKRPAGDKRQ